MANSEGQTQHSELAIIDDHQPFGAYRPDWRKNTIWRLRSWFDQSGFPGVEFWRRQCARFPGPADITFDGTRLRIYPLEDAASHDLMAGKHAIYQELVGRLQSVLQTGSTMVDIGSGIGLITILASRLVGTSGRVLAIEPNERSMRKLRFNLALNHCANTEIHQAAIRTDDGFSDFWLEPERGQDNANSADNQGLHNAEKTRTNNRKLELLLKDERLDHIDLMRIDMGGDEDQALNPFFRTASVSLFPKAILLEAKHANLWREDLVIMLNQLGYRSESNQGEILLLVRQIK